jgi:hypothetical protein
MAMLSEPDLLDAIFETVLRGCDVDIKARKNAIWNAAVCLLADVLRETDPFNRERLLRGIEAELRGSVAHLDQLLKPAPYPRTPEQVH